MPAPQKQQKRTLVLASLIVSMFMASIEATIVATAMPDIVATLGGFSVYSWVFSSYLLMQAVTVPIFGKLADQFGRKPIFLGGVGVFLLGCLLCGLAPSMEWLILFRFIQGLGAGAVHPMAMTIVGDMYSVEERARIQGWLASVWAVSSILGPLAGGLIVQYWDWSWVFWIGIPFGVISAVGVHVFLREDFERRRHSVDWLGGFLFFVAVVALMLVLVQGGVSWAWTSPAILGLAALAAVAFTLFLRQEARAPEPIIPLDLWRNRLIATVNTLTLTSGMVMIGLTTFLPTYVQGTMGQSAIVAGFALTAMSIGWPVAATVAGRLLMRMGNRNLTIAGGAILMTGGFILLLMTGASGPLHAAIGSFIVGCGMGFVNTAGIVTVQSSVSWERRGVATASQLFSRIMGNALGAAVFGSVLNTVIMRQLAAGGATVEMAELRLLLDAGVGAVRENPDLLAALGAGMDAVYAGVFIAAAATFVLALLTPEIIRRRAEARGGSPRSDAR